MSKELRPN